MSLSGSTPRGRRSVASPRAVGAMLIALCAIIPPSGAAAGASEEIPDIELLEFLGAWQTADGEFLDPLLLAGAPDDIPPVENDDED